MLKIFNDTHPIFRSISLIHLLHTLTRECSTCKTKLQIIFLATVFDCASSTGDRFHGGIYPTTEAFVLLPEKGDTHTTIDAAGSEQ
jgi:hypothetical protein